MLDVDEALAEQASALCLACGMCCNGQLFTWVKLKPSELDPAEQMGLRVSRSDPARRGFSQPCPLWRGRCTIYQSPHYPRACRAYRCKQLKALLAGSTTLEGALAVVGEAQRRITELEAMLPSADNPNFRERLVAQIEAPGAAAGDPGYQAFRVSADALLAYYEEYFGVDDLLAPY